LLVALILEVYIVGIGFCILYNQEL